MNEELKIVTIGNKDDEKFLRKKTENFDFTKFSRAEIAAMLSDMREAMIRANGIGLSANQIGLPYKVFVARVPQSQNNYKSYAIFNPVIEKSGTDKAVSEEGCLSIPEVFGNVPRPDKITISGYDKNGKPLKLKAWGLLARVFQHEIDHLNGKLFIDRTKQIYNTKIKDQNGK